MACVLALAGGCSGDDDPSAGSGAGSDAGSGTGEASEALVAARPVVEALADESARVEMDLIGTSSFGLGPDDLDTAAAREQTDAALDRLADAGPGVDTGAAGSALVDLRSEVDASTAPQTMESLGFVIEVSDGYWGVTDDLLAELAARTEQVDDPEARAGLELYVEGVRQRGLHTQLQRAALLVVVAPDDPTMLTELAETRGLVSAGQARLADLAAGTPYEDAAAALAADLEEAGLLAVADQVIATGEADIATIIEAVPGNDMLAQDQGWPQFLDAVENELPGG